MYVLISKPINIMKYFNFRFNVFTFAAKIVDAVYFKLTINK